MKILGMSSYRKKYIEKLESYSDKLEEHVLKCIVYPENNSKDEWIKEISAWLLRPCITTVKPKGKKLKADDYRDSIFSCFGDEKVDAELSLAWFKDVFISKPENKKKYPDFEITDELVNKVFNTYNKFIKIFLPLFTSKDKITGEECKSIVRTILS